MLATSQQTHIFEAVNDGFMQRILLVFNKLIDEFVLRFLYWTL